MVSDAPDRLASLSEIEVLRRISNEPANLIFFPFSSEGKWKCRWTFNSICGLLCHPCHRRAANLNSLVSQTKEKDWSTKNFNIRSDNRGRRIRIEKIHFCWCSRNYCNEASNSTMLLIGFYLWRRLLISAHYPIVMFDCGFFDKFRPVNRDRESLHGLTPWSFECSWTFKIKYRYASRVVYDSFVKIFSSSLLSFEQTKKNLINFNEIVLNTSWDTLLRNLSSWTSEGFRNEWNSTTFEYAFCVHSLIHAVKTLSSKCTLKLCEQFEYISTTAPRSGCEGLSRDMKKSLPSLLKSIVCSKQLSGLRDTPCGCEQKTKVWFV